jgi:hypothetical protein
MMRVWFGWLSLVLLVAACGDDVGPEGETVGGPCTAHGECADGSFCETDSDFPGGMCTLHCNAHAECPDEAACIDVAGGICMQLCASDNDCRAGYVCRGKRDTTGSGESVVCIEADVT